MSSGVAENAIPGLRVFDLGTARPAELAALWEHQAQVWHDRLLWDTSDAHATLRRVIERGGLPGKVVRVGAQVVGCAYYLVAGRLGVLAGLVMSPAWHEPAVVGALVRETVHDIRRKDVSRIESQFIAIDSPWLTPSFEQEGFQAYWREFLRLRIARPSETANPPPMVRIEPWQVAHLGEAASIMQAAYAGGIDVEISQLYRRQDGCRVVLENIWQGGGCGNPVAEASAMARHRGRSIGFVLITAIAHQQGHLAQVAVLPEYQGQGVGRLLLSYSVSRLATLQFETLSLFVSRANTRALRMYQSMGFASVLACPVFVWEQ